MRIYVISLTVAVSCALLPLGGRAEAIDTEHLFAFTQDVEMNGRLAV